MAKKLTEEHPLTKKVRKVEELMDELGLSIDMVYDGLTITDSELGITVRYVDADNRETCQQFPYMCETYLRLEE